MKRTFRIVVEYDGSDFHGWQFQPDVRTVQGEIEEAIGRLTGERCRVYGAGRTDAGVHALHQVASFSLASGEVSAGKLLGGLNALTGQDVTIHRVEQAEEGFDARKGVYMKFYRYSIFNSQFPSPLKRRSYLHIKYPLDVEKMKAAAGYFTGRKDWSAFRASDCDDPDPVKRMYECRVENHEHIHGRLITIDLKGKGFLKYMVRIIAGTLIDVGKGRIEPEQVGLIVDSKDRNMAGPTAPPHGLTLMNVVYGEES